MRLSSLLFLFGLVATISAQGDELSGFDDIFNEVDVDSGSATPPTLGPIDIAEQDALLASIQAEVVEAPDAPEENIKNLNPILDEMTEESEKQRVEMAQGEDAFEAKWNANTPPDSIVTKLPTNAPEKPNPVEPGSEVAGSSSTTLNPNKDDDTSSTTKVLVNGEAETSLTTAIAANGEAETTPTTAIAANGEAETTPTTAITANGEAETTPTTAIAANGEAETTPTTAITANGEAETTPTTAIAANGEAETTPTTAIAANGEAETSPTTAATENADFQKEDEVKKDDYRKRRSLNRPHSEVELTDIYEKLKTRKHRSLRHGRKAPIQGPGLGQLLSDATGDNRIVF